MRTKCNFYPLKKPCLFLQASSGRQLLQNSMDVHEMLQLQICKSIRKKTRALFPASLCLKIQNKTLTKTTELPCFVSSIFRMYFLLLFSSVVFCCTNKTASAFSMLPILRKLKLSILFLRSSLKHAQIGRKNKFLFSTSL